MAYLDETGLAYYDGKIKDWMVSDAEVTVAGSTTARTLPERFADVFNVKDFGAKGDGIADDATAINAAINAASTAGGIVFLPRGVYLVGYTQDSEEQRCAIVMKSRVALIGVGINSSIIKLKNNAKSHVIMLRDCDKTLMSNFRIEGNKANQSTPSSGQDSCGILACGTYSDSFITNVYINDTFDYGIGVEVGNAQNVSIENVTINGANADGIDFKNTSSISRGNTLRNITIKSFGLSSSQEDFAGIDIRGQVTASQIKILNIPLHQGSDYRCGIRLHGGTASQTNAKSVGTSISDIYVCGGDNVASNELIHGVFVQGRFCNVNNVYVEKCGHGISVLQEKNNISNCIVRNCKTGLWFYSAGTSGGSPLESDAVKNNVSNLIVTNSSSCGIKIDENSSNNSFVNVVSEINDCNLSFSTDAVNNVFFGGSIDNAITTNIQDNSGGTNTYVNVSGVE